jgi:hypothetical protein
MSQIKAVQLKMEAADKLQELFRALFRKKFGQPGPDDPVVLDPEADSPQRMAEEKHAQQLADTGEAAGLPPHFVFAIRQTGLIVKERNRYIMPKQKIEGWERAIDEYFRRAG